MSFSCSRSLETTSEESASGMEEKDIKKTKSVKRPCPFPASKEDCEVKIIPEAVDVINDIFASICSLKNENDPQDEVTVVYEDIVTSGQKNSSPKSSDDDRTLLASEDVTGLNPSEDSFCSYNFEHIPLQITGAWKEFDSKTTNNFTKGCKWAPDGSCILTCSDDNTLRIFNMPQEIWDTRQWQDISEMEAVLKIPEGELVYDYCWYPLMNSSDPCTSCLISCSRNKPVHLWDAFTGELRCSYRSYDHVDELTAPHSLSFDTDGQRIFCGFEKVVRVFDVNLPGRTYQERKLYAKKSGQYGIVSCFAFTPTNRNMSVVGTYNRTIGIYSEPDGVLECVLEGQRGGVTQIQFSPDGNLLYSGGRKDPEILCWDMRNLGSILYCMRRKCDTNQRMYFDVTSCGRYVISGNQNGVITIWDTTREPKEVNPEENCILEPTQFFMAHKDCVNGISIHPTHPLLCSSSGQRKFAQLLPDEDDQMFSRKITERDNSLRLWWIGE